MRHRRLATHRMHCALLDVQDPGLASQFSTKHGVNRLSILNDLPYFDLTLCLPLDIMHVILEGALPRNIRLLLFHCVESKSIFQ